MDEKPLLAVLSGQAVWPPPIWLMRQAGRYLPEYRALRAKAGSFWTMCNDPEMATEITLQPIRRFGFDAAIIFSDILTVPYALGRKITFTDGEGPSLEPVRSLDELEIDTARWSEKLAPAYETLRQVRRSLPERTTLLGFAGAPWTLATYMAAGRGGDEQRAARLWADRDPEGFRQLLEVTADCVAQHLIAQLEAGADAVQIFDSWAGGLSDGEVLHWVIEPTARITAAVRKRKPGALIIGFPRGMQPGKAEHFWEATHVNAISVDTHTPLPAIYAPVHDRAALQGNLDPQVLVRGGEAMRHATERTLDQMRAHRFVFNLGHGVLPETPPEHVAALVAQVRAA